MKLRRGVKIALAVFAALMLVAVTSLAVRETPAQTETSATVASTPVECTGQCADCPLAGTEQCAACHESADARTAEAQSAREVDAAKCIACGRCVQVAPDAYEIDPDTGKARIKDGAPADAIEAGARACPVGAIDR